jgi:ribonuclease HI
MSACKIAVSFRMPYNYPMTESLKIYFDGGCKPNPGIREVAVVVCSKRPECHHERLNYGTNNEAEWLALLWAIEIAQTHDARNITFIGDSKLVINQALGLWKIKHEPLIPFKEHFVQRKRNLGKINLVFVRRQFNLAGHHLEAMNRKPEREQPRRRWS